VTNIGVKAFYLGSLTNVVFPDNLISIEILAFAYCDLTSVTFPDTLKDIGGGAFSYNPMIDLVIPVSVTNIGNNVFLHCDELTSVVFEGDAPASVGTSAFGALDTSSVTVYFTEGASGFSTPTWNGYPCEMLSVFGPDTDGDGIPDTLEELMGTDLNDPDDCLHGWLSRDASGMHIHYAPHADACQFAVESTTNLTAASDWQTVPDLSFAGDSAGKAADLPDSDSPCVFYRVRVGLQE
jgi:hypothetical protein